MTNVDFDDYFGISGSGNWKPVLCRLLWDLGEGEAEECERLASGDPYFIILSQYYGVLVMVWWWWWCRWFRCLQATYSWCYSGSQRFALRGQKLFKWPCFRSFPYKRFFPLKFVSSNIKSFCYHALSSVEFCDAFLLPVNFSFLSNRFQRAMFWEGKRDSRCSASDIFSFQYV